jgi:hypothetical protein
MISTIKIINTMKETEEDTKNGKSYVNGLEELILLKCSYYPK